MIGDSSGAVYDSPVHHALGLHTDFAEDSPDTDPSSVVSYDDSKSPENNWNALSPQDKENTQNGWSYNPGNLVPYGDIKKEAPGGMYFSPDYQHQDYIERLKNEHDYEHYKDEKGNQFLIPKAKAPLVGSLEGMTKLAGDTPIRDTELYTPDEVVNDKGWFSEYGDMLKDPDMKPLVDESKRALRKLQQLYESGDADARSAVKDWENRKFNNQFDVERNMRTYGISRLEAEEEREYQRSHRPEEFSEERLAKSSEWFSRLHNSVIKDALDNEENLTPEMKKKLESWDNFDMDGEIQPKFNDRLKQKLRK